jgi:hypothetical protein
MSPPPQTGAENSTYGRVLAFYHKLCICKFSPGLLTRYDASSTFIKFASVEVKRLKLLISVVFRLEKKKIKKFVGFSGVFGVCRP